MVQVLVTHKGDWDDPNILVGVYSLPSEAEVEKLQRRLLAGDFIVSKLDASEPIMTIDQVLEDVRCQMEPPSRGVPPDVEETT